MYTTILYKLSSSNTFRSLSIYQEKNKNIAIIDHISEILMFPYLLSYRLQNTLNGFRMKDWHFDLCQAALKKVELRQIVRKISQFKKIKLSTSSTKYNSFSKPFAT